VNQNNRRTSVARSRWGTCMHACMRTRVHRPNGTMRDCTGEHSTGECARKHSPGRRGSQEPRRLCRVPHHLLRHTAKIHAGSAHPAWPTWRVSRENVRVRDCLGGQANPLSVDAERSEKDATGMQQGVHLSERNHHERDTYAACSTTAVRAPYDAAREAAAIPPLPAPRTSS
jgi:hypothetical protein